MSKNACKFRHAVGEDGRCSRCGNLADPGRLYRWEVERRRPSRYGEAHRRAESFREPYLIGVTGRKVFGPHLRRSDFTANTQYGLFGARPAKERVGVTPKKVQQEPDDRLWFWSVALPKIYWAEPCRSKFMAACPCMTCWKVDCVCDPYSGDAGEEWWKDTVGNYGYAQGVSGVSIPESALDNTSVAAASVDRHP